MTHDAPDEGRLDGRRHLLPVRVYYEDTDFSGRVYHARYLQFLERGRSELLRSLGVVHAELLALPRPLAFAVARMTVEFKAAARIDDALVVQTKVGAATGVRIVMEQEVRRGAETIVAAEVEVACVTMDGRPSRAPKEVAAAFKALARKG